MKFLKVLMGLMIISFSLQAQKNEGIIFENGLLNDALKKASLAKNSNRLVFVDCYTSWCGPCKLMSSNVFTQKDVGKYFNSNFINVKIDMEKGEGPEIARKYSVKSFPTFLILNSKGEEITRIIGSYEPQEFIKKTEYSINNSPLSLKQKYENDKCPENAAKYLQTLTDAQKTAELNQFLSAELQTFDIGDRYSPNMWDFVATALASKNPDVFNIVTDDIAEANMLVGKDNVANSLKQSAQKTIISYITGKEKNLSAEDIKKRIMVLGMTCDSKDVYSLTLKQIAKAVMNNDYSRMAGTLSPFKILTLSSEEVATMEYIMSAIQDKLDPNVLVEYFTAASNLAKGQSERYNAILNQK